MSAFDNVLKQIEARLDLPADVRKRVLLDLAADLEGLRQAALDSGLDDEAAHARALEFADLSDEAVVALAMLQLVGGLFANGSVTRSAGMLSWISLGVLFASALLGAVCAYRYRIASDERSAPMLRAATWASRMSAAQFGIGALGLAITTLRASARIDSTAPDVFAITPGSGIPEGVREHLLLLQSQTAILSLVGLGALASLLLAHRLAGRARLLGLAEQELRADLRGTSPPLSPQQGNQVPCSN